MRALLRYGLRFDGIIGLFQIGFDRTYCWNFFFFVCCLGIIGMIVHMLEFFYAFVKFDFIGTIIIFIVLYGIFFPYINNVVLCQFC